MRKYRAKMTNAVESAKWTRVKVSGVSNNTTNCVIGADIFKRECDEFDAGILPFEHELYIGESRR